MQLEVFIELYERKCSETQVESDQSSAMECFQPRKMQLRPWCLKTDRPFQNLGSLTILEVLPKLTTGTISPIMNESD